MNAKQAEEATGISRRNLRFYEDRGLIHPGRNPENDYRDFSDNDIQALKKIRALRMLDVSLEDISAVLDGTKSLVQVMKNQEQLLKRKQKELETALYFCRELQAREPDVDTLLSRMDQPENRTGLFAAWVRDYQTAARLEAKKSFSFLPEEAVTTPQEFTMALLKYGSDTGKNLVVTKEGMEPEFTIDGIAYHARRIYRPMGYCIQVPVSVILCNAEHPEDFDSDPETVRHQFMGLLYHGWWMLPVLLLESFVSYRLGGNLWTALLLAALTVPVILTVHAVIFRSWTR